MRDGCDGADWRGLLRWAVVFRQGGNEQIKGHEGAINGHDGGVDGVAVGGEGEAKGAAWGELM